MQHDYCMTCPSGSRSGIGEPPKITCSSNMNLWHDKHLGVLFDLQTDWRIGKHVNDSYIQSILYKFCISTWNFCWIYSQSCLHISVSLGGSTADMALAPKPSQLLHKVLKNARHINHLSAWPSCWLQQNVCSQATQKLAGRRTATREATALGSSKVSNLGEFEIWTHIAALPRAHVWDNSYIDRY